MKLIYANLLGNWTDITNTGTINGSPAKLYIQEQLQDLFKYDYINVVYGFTNYRIHPSDIQVITRNN